MADPGGGKREDVVPRGEDPCRVVLLSTEGVPPELAALEAANIHVQQVDTVKRAQSMVAVGSPPAVIVTLGKQSDGSDSGVAWCAA